MLNIRNSGEADLRLGSSDALKSVFMVVFFLSKRLISEIYGYLLGQYLSILCICVFRNLYFGKET